MSQLEDTPQQGPDPMQQNVRQAGDQPSNENQDVISFPLATPQWRTSLWRKCLHFWILWKLSTLTDLTPSGRLFFPEAHAAQASDPNVLNSNGTGYLGWPPATNTPGSNGAVAFTCPNPSIMMAAPNGPAPQNDHETFRFQFLPRRYQ